MRDHEFFSANEKRMFSFTLRDLLAIGFRQKRVAALCFFGILLGTLLAVLFTPARYLATTKILVKRERVDPVVTSEQNNPLQVRDEVTEEELNSEVELIESEDVLRQTVLKMELDRRRSLLSSLLHQSHEANVEKAVQRLRSNLTVEPVKKTSLISITYASHEPKLAARVLNELANAYIEKHLAVHRPPGQLKFFEQETERYHLDLSSAENQLRKFSSEQGGVAPQLARDITLQKLNDFNASLQQTRAELAATEKRIRDLEKQSTSTPDRLTTQVREADDAQVLQQLKSTLLNLELKRTELLTKYQPNYRLVQEVEKQISDTRAAIASEESKPIREQTTDQNPTYGWISTELAKAKADYSALQAREAATQAIVAMYQTSAHKLEEKGLLQQDLLRTVKADEENYLLYQRKREEARMADALDQTRILNVAIAESPSVPAIPTNSPIMLALVGTLLAVTVSVGSAFTMEYLDPSFRTPSEVFHELNIPVLAAPPHQNDASPNGNGNHAGGESYSRTKAQSQIPSDKDQLQ